MHSSVALNVQKEVWACIYDATLVTCCIMQATNMLLLAWKEGALVHRLKSTKQSNLCGLISR